MFRPARHSKPALAVLPIIALMVAPAGYAQNKASRLQEEKVVEQGRMGDKAAPVKANELAPALLKPTELTAQGSVATELKPSEPKPQAAEGVPKKPVVSPIISVKLALMADARLFPYEIDVDVKGTEAALVGKVSSEQEKAVAGEVAQGVPGIKSVLNKLEVVKELNQVLARKRDERMTEDVKARFERSKTLKTVGFDVKTENGVVFLGGKTRFQVIVLEAAESAREVPGVKAVRTDGVRLEAEE